MTAPVAAVGGELVSPPAAGVVAGLDVGTRHHGDADALAERLAGLLPAAWAGGVTVATHVEPGPPAHLVLTLAVPADADSAWPSLVAAVTAAGLDTAALVAGDHAVGPAGHLQHARSAVVAHVTGGSGRVALFPGVAGLPPALTVGELLERSPVERVRVLAGGEAPAAAMLLTRGFLRPRWSGGVLVLHVQPAAGGVLVPFETPAPTPCCADHP